MKEAAVRPIALTSPEQIERFRLAQIRAAIRMEELGMRHSSGRSATKLAKELLGLPARATRIQVIEAINTRLASE